MGDSLIKIDDRLNKKEIIMQTAIQCAPLLMNLKISNILIVGCEEADKVRQMFNESKLSCYLLFKCKRRAVFLVYSQKGLLSYINEAPQKEFLRILGYENLELDGMLKKLSSRYEYFMERKEGFPHELGILLGYPTEDVRSFISCEGRDFLYTGYWKVYHNLPQALETFKSFDRAKEHALKLVSEGYKIEQIIADYHTHKEKQIAI